MADALASVRGDRLIETQSKLSGDTWSIRCGANAVDWVLPTDGRLLVIGAGKAVGALAQGVLRMLGDRVDGGCLITKYGHSEPTVAIPQLEAGHPLPDDAGVAATAALLETVSDLTERDAVIMLLTGGASALLVAPVEGVTLAEKARTTELLLRSRASVEEINCVRRRLSRVKDGRLLDHIAPAAVLTLMLSDVPSGDWRAIGSGPTIAAGGSEMDPLEIVERYGLRARLPGPVCDVLARPAEVRPPPPVRNAAIVVGDRHTLVEAVRAAAGREDLPVIPVDLAMRGDTHDASHVFASALSGVSRSDRPALLVSAGETTLEVTGTGKGGRNQEFALCAAIALDGTEGATLLAVGTDGTDGPTPTAGAFADGKLCARARAMGLDPQAALADNDSHGFFERTGDLIHTGPTGTNLMDLVLGLAAPTSTAGPGLEADARDARRFSTTRRGE
ncbi:glycerate kinase [Sphingomonas sp. DBB INV C78]|uniref:glycerate kinase type-2 family protein n=1 Tax=Sphingomonas sp. DBB INV C78 TaxID=3349434 RepID=UPI0036D2326D